MPSHANLESLQDGELMDLVSRKDQGAFSEFYRRYASGLYSMIFQILKEQRESEDTLQEALVQIWKKADTYDAGRSTIFTWAVMIARHRAIDRARARQRRRKADEAVAEEFATHPVTDSASGDRAAERNEDRRRILDAMEALPSEQREAVECAFFSGLTHEEVSTKLAAPLGTVKARIRRGLLALREALQKP